MKNFKLEYAILLLLLFLNISNLICQEDSCHIYPANSLACAFKIHEVQIAPPINQFMPYDCIAGYLMLDTLAKSMPDSTIQKNLFKMSDDSLFFALRYRYNIQDFSPSLTRAYFDYSENLVSSHYYNSYPATTYYTLSRVVEKRIEEIGYTKSLIYLSDYIVRIRVNCVDNIIDSTFTYPEQWTNVQSEVISVLKGQILPNNCEPDNPEYDKWLQNYGNYVKSQTPQCLRFGFFPEMKTNDGFKEFSSLKGGWGIIPKMIRNKEYIVFLRQYALRGDIDFLTLFTEIGKNGGIFEISEDNKVIDIDNLFGLGNNPDADEFISKINSIIYKIKTSKLH